MEIELTDREMLILRNSLVRWINSTTDEKDELIKLKLKFEGLIWEQN